MRIIREGLTSLYSFSAAVFLPLVTLLVATQYDVTSSKLVICGSIAFTSWAVVNGLFLLVTKESLMQIVVRASFLGCVFFCGICVSIFGLQNWNIFGWYMCVLSTFHYSEYLCISVTNPKTLRTDAFMLNHSLAYEVAAVASWIEFSVEQYFFPGLKNYFFISLSGLTLCVVGEIIRKGAMLTASTNFNHVVQTVKEADHKLVTHGVYSFCRHPSYVGWFYWSIGTQCILVNPVCIVTYALASYAFFKSRLVVEEEALIDFFGDEYVQYKKHVHSGLPFNDGVQLERL